MSRGILGCFLACVALVIVARPAVAFIAIDGDLADWGVTAADDNLSDWSPFGPLDGMHLEDTGDGAGPGFFLGPNFGGQDYDAEFMAVRSDTEAIYIAIVSGQRPDNGYQFFGPGDIRIETTGGTYGIEVGGGFGAGGSPIDAGGAIPGEGTPLTEGAPGSTYNLDGDGFTVSHNSAPLGAPPPAQVVGSVWRDAIWILDPIVPQGPVQLSTGALVGMADFVFTRDSATSQHSIIELSIPRSLFDEDVIVGAFWRPASGVDELNVIVPEPTSLALAALGLASLFLGWRCRRRR